MVDLKIMANRSWHDVKVKYDDKGNVISSTYVSNNDLSTVLAQLMLTMHPVGTIKMTADNVNPSTYIGGTWELWGAGRVPVGVDTTDTDFDTAEATGGEKEVSYTPEGTNKNGAVENTTLTQANVGFRTSSQEADGYGLVKSQTFVNRVGVTMPPTAHGHGFTQPSFEGTSANINNMQPYITCYMWKRTA